MAIYLDHAATTPLHPEVFEAMKPYFVEHFGNPSSIHQFGRKNRGAIDEARSLIARKLNTKPSQLIFTSGGTESDNTAIIGTLMANRHKGNHIITTQIEHHAVLSTCEYIEKLGFHVTYLPVDNYGRVSMEDVAAAITDETVLITIMYGNNEVGTIQPIEEIAALAKEKGVIFHTDAVQALGVSPLDLNQLGADIVSISAHKINGPKAVGLLYIAPGIKVDPLLIGGSQERSRRAGTENVSGIVGFAKAVELATENWEEKRDFYLQLRNAMLTIWEQEGLAFTVNGHPISFLPHILNVSFLGLHTEALLMNLDIVGVAASSGSACTAGSLEISHVLKAMNLPLEVQQSAIRFSFGYGLTIEDVEVAAKKTAEIVKKNVR